MQICVLCLVAMSWGQPDVSPEPAGAAIAQSGDAGDVVEVQEGYAIWYGGKWHGRRTASGERFDKRAMTAAHRTLPMGTRVRVVNALDGRQVVVRINDRGPWGKDRSRIIDVSQGAAEKLGFGGRGSIPVRVEVLAD